MHTLIHTHAHTHTHSVSQRKPKMVGSIRAGSACWLYTCGSRYQTMENVVFSQFLAGGTKVLAFIHFHVIHKKPQNINNK